MHVPLTRYAQTSDRPVEVQRSIYRIARNFRGLKFLSIASCRLNVIKSNRPSAKIKSRNFSGSPIRENFSPRKFLAIR